MYQTSLYYRLVAADDKKKVLDLFFKDWADGICNDEVAYSTVSSYRVGQKLLYETIRVDFNNAEDATAMLLKGIPKELQTYLQMHK